MSGSGLFENFERRLREEVRREFRESEAGRLLTAAESAANTGPRMKGRAKATVDKYIKNPFMKGVVDLLLQEFGPLGAAVKSLLRPGGKKLTTVQRELLAAKALIEAFGGTVDLPAEEFGGQIPEPTGQPAKEQPIDGHWSWQPFEFVRKTSQAAKEQPIDGQVVIHAGGFKLYRDENDPIVTGKMISVQSSNVHSIGFQLNWDNPSRSTLLVRFLQKRNNNSVGPGPLYAYYNVHPLMFDAFQEAASKGRWVWDRLRIRGTVTGHQKHYELIGVVNGYVPRKATRYGQNQYFMQRALKFESKRSGQKRVIESSLPNQLVGKYRPNRQAVLNRGMPNRGAPNRGRP